MVGLVFEEPFFAVEAAPVAAQRAGGLDHAVAGDDDGDAVRAVGRADGALGAGARDAVGEFAVAGGPPERDGEQGGPDLLLEGRSGCEEGKVKVRTLAGEIGGELVERCAQRGAGVRWGWDGGRCGEEALEVGPFARESGSIDELEQDKRGIGAIGSLGVGDGAHGAEWGFEVGGEKGRCHG